MFVLKVTLFWVHSEPEPKMSPNSSKDGLKNVIYFLNFLKIRKHRITASALAAFMPVTFHYYVGRVFSAVAKINFRNCGKFAPQLRSPNDFYIWLKWYKGSKSDAGKLHTVTFRK